MEFVSVMFGGYIDPRRIVAFSGSVKSNPLVAMAHKAEEDNKMIDLTTGNKTHCFVFTDTGHVIRIYPRALTLATRLAEIKWTDEKN